MEKKNIKPLYALLTEQLKTQILAGSYTFPNKLPSIRLLSHHLKLSKTTIITAYEQLVAEGFVENRARSGYYVNPLPELSNVDIVKQNFAEKEVKPIQYHLGQSNISISDFPHQTWKRMLNLALRDYDLQLGDQFGLVQLRRLIADYLFISRGVKASYQQIIIGAGVQSLSQVITGLFDRKIIAYENPGYNGIRNVFENADYKIEPISIEETGLNMKQLSRTEFSLVFVSPSHQYPLGKILPIKERFELLRIANDKNAFIIEDDYDSEFRYMGKPIPSLHSLDETDSVIYMNTFSKAFMPSLRMAYMVLPRKLISHPKIRQFENTSAALLQSAMFHFMERGHWMKHIRKMRKIYGSKLELLKHELKMQFKQKIEIDSSDTGIRLLLMFKSKQSEQFLFEAALSEGIFIKRLTSSWYSHVNESEKKLFMLGFGNLNADNIKKVCAKLAKTWLEHID